MDKFLSILSEYLKAAGAAISHYAPQAYQTTLDLIRICAFVHIGELVLVWLVFWTVLYKSKNWIEASSLEEAHSYHCDKYDLRVMRRMFGSVLGIGLGFVTILSALDLFLGAFFPQLYLVYQVASKAGIL